MMLCQTCNRLREVIETKPGSCTFGSSVSVEEELAAKERDGLKSAYNCDLVSVHTC